MPYLTKLKNYKLFTKKEIKPFKKGLLKRLQKGDIPEIYFGIHKIF